MLWKIRAPDTMRYCVLGIAALALLHPAEGHIHNHNKRSGQLPRHEMEIRQQQHQQRRCSKESPTTTTLTIYVDEFGHTLDASPSTTSVISVLNKQVTIPSSIFSITAATISSTTSLSKPLPSLSLSSPSSPSPASKKMQTGRYIIPQATDISRLTNSNHLDPNFISDTSNNLLPGRKNNKYGISYTGYNDDGTCKTQEEVNSDIAQLRQFAYVRFYGVDCNQAQTISKAARGNNMQVFAGVFDIENMDDDLQKIIDAADGDWSTFHTISVGNELVNRGQSSPAEVVGAVSAARNRLRQAGYQGPVVTVDTSSQMIAHPELCDASDYCAANCHAFFDSTQTPENAGPYVLEQARRVSQATREGNKRVIITESGWPSAGEANGKAVPSRQNQMVALKSLQQSFPDGGIVFFSAFNDNWKQDNPWTFGTEKHWGLFDLAGTNGGIAQILNPLTGDGV